jgi:hypothetical protein
LVGRHHKAQTFAHEIFPPQEELQEQRRLLPVTFEIDQIATLKTGLKDIY